MISLSPDGDDLYYVLCTIHMHPKIQMVMTRIMYYHCTYACITPDSDDLYYVLSTIHMHA